MAVNDVSFDIRKGETLGLVGESGSGKSVTAFSMMRLVQPPGRIVGGRVVFQGRDLLSLSEREMCAVRGAGIGLVFQEPMAALNPVMRVGRADRRSAGGARHGDIAARRATRGHRTAARGQDRRSGQSASTTIRTSCRVACASASCWPSRSPASRRW